MRAWTLGAVVGAVCAGILAMPAAASAAEKPDRPVIGPCKGKVDEVETKPKGKTAAERKADAKGANDQTLQTGVTVICT